MLTYLLFFHVLGGVVSGILWVTTLVAVLQNVSQSRLRQLSNLINGGILFQVVTGFGLILSQPVTTVAFCVRLSVYFGLLILVEIGFLNKLRPTLGVSYARLIPLVLMGGLVVTSLMRLN